MNDDRLAASGRPIRSGPSLGHHGVCRRHHLLLFVFPPLASCSGAQSALDPAGPEAAGVATLFYTMLIGGIVIWCGVVGLLFYAARKRRAHSTKSAGQLVLWGGAVFPTVVLAALLTYAVWLMPVMRPWFQDDASGMRRIEVTGEQFWWRVRYLGEDSRPVFETANEVRIPVGERVVFLLKSPDVIHSFWIPVLGGKMDMIPGRENRLTLVAEKPGTYRGVCAEFCGPSHALMAFTVHAMEPRDYEAWLSARKTSSGADAEGLALFLRHGCAACHAISGTEARGTIGPDLTAFGERGSVGAGSLANTAEHIARFIRFPDGVKPQVRMPHFSMLPDADVERIATYLKGLR